MMKTSLLGSMLLGSVLLVGACAAGDDVSADPTDTSEQDVTASGSGCAQVSIVTARASTENPGEGITGALAQAIQNDSAQTVSRASVSYPATLQNYGSSVSQGASAAATQVTNLANSCPNTKIVLLGYSQGAQVMVTLIGGSVASSGASNQAALSASILSHVKAVAVFGNPAYTPSQGENAINGGTDTNRNGRFANTAAHVNVLDNFGKIREWCDTNDTFCASGNSVQVHLTYLNRYQTTAENFVLGKIGG